MCRLIWRASEIFCRRRAAVSTILTNVSHKDPCAILSRGSVIRRAQRPNGSLGVLPSCRQGVRRANWFAFTPRRIRRARTQPEALLPPPPSRSRLPSAFTLQNHIIHLFTHLSVLRAAGIVRLIELPEACAAGYHARRSPYFALSDAGWMYVVYCWRRRRSGKGSL